MSITKLLLERNGTDFSRYKRGTLSRRVARRMGMLGITDIGDYLKLLQKDPAEAERHWKAILRLFGEALAP